MYNCIKKYCENSENNGLFLLDMPTGFGKTYNVIKYIADFVSDPANKDKKVFFITTMKKNLPIDDLKKQLRDIGRPELIKEILFLDSVSESAIMNYNGRMKIPYGIKKICLLKPSPNHHSNHQLYKTGFLKGLYMLE